MERERLLKIECINKKDSFSAISYLVSKMEGIDCFVLEIPIMLYEQNIIDGCRQIDENNARDDVLVLMLVTRNECLRKI